MAGIHGARRDFFISRAGEDKDVALVVDQILRDAGYTTFVQDKDFGHVAFTERMDEGFRMVEAGARIVGLLSRAYQDEPHCRIEAQYPLADDPTNSRQRLIVLRIEECAAVGLLKPIPYVDLVPLLNDATAVRQAVLGAADPEQHREAADFTALYRRSGTQIIHPEVRPVPGFAARGNELQALEAALWKKSGRAAITDTKANTTGASAAVKGMGGVGKSVLAQRYAWENRERYQGVWWVRAETRETLLDDLIALGSRFVDKLAEMPDREAAARIVLDHIAQTQWEKPWLLVYDNVESPTAIDNLTPANGAHVLITTRWSDWYGHAYEVPVDVFAGDVAIRFLLDATKRTARDAAGRLADALGCLPLALDHAAAYIRRTGIDFDTYGKLAADLMHKAPKGVGYATPVFATFSLAIDKAVEACPEAEKLMGVCAFLAPDRIPLNIFTSDVLSEIERGEAVAALAEVSLVTRETLDDGSPGLSVHRLVQQVVRRRLGDGGAEIAALATKVVADAYPAGETGPDDVRSWPICRRLESHVVAILTTAPGVGDPAQNTTRLLNQYALHLNARAEFAAAEPLMRRALAIDEASLGPDHPNVGIDLNNLAQLLKATNRLAEAEPPMRRALAIDEASFGPDHPDVATDLNNLALLLKATNRLAEAEPPMRRALAIFERSLGAEHPSSRTVRTNLELLLAEIGSAASGGATAPAPTKPAAPADGGAAKRGLLARLFGRNGRRPAGA